MADLGVRLRSNFGILRADWWLKNVTLEPHYSDFLGIKTIEDYKDLAGFDPRAEITQAKATVVMSGSEGLCPRVARNNRILARRSTFQGYWWETYDFKESTGERNVITNFLNKKRDAAEFIASLPNGLQFYAITDDKNKLLDKGDPEIVGDSMAIDTLVRNGRSCIWCHGQGINAFKSNFQRQVGGKPDQSDLGIYLKDVKASRELAQKVRDVFGLPDFDDVIKADRERYAKAVRAACDLTPEEAAASFKQFWDAYQEDLVDIPKACHELGLQPDELKAVLALRLNGVSNGVLVQALLEPPVAIRRDHWEEHFTEAALLATVRHPVVGPALPLKAVK
jgi:hypothetical protein